MSEHVFPQLFIFCLTTWLFFEIQLYFAELFGNDWIFFSIFISAAKYFGMLKKSVVAFGFCLIFTGGMKCWWKILKFLKIKHFQSNIFTLRKAVHAMIAWNRKKIQFALSWVLRIIILWWYNNWHFVFASPLLLFCCLLGNICNRLCLDNFWVPTYIIQCTNEITLGKEITSRLQIR